MMNSKYKITFIITGLLLLLSISLSFISYVNALNNTQRQLKTQSLPLSLDNVYADIQKSIIQPHLVSSMMASDTFVQEWMHNGEKDETKIIKYLKSVKNKYNMFTTFFVSENTKRYYTNEGFKEVLSQDKPTNSWYYKFKASQESKELNLDFNKYISNSLILFINHKILDENFNYLGATGVALKLSYINDLLKKFRQEYSFRITFYDRDGVIVLVEDKNLHLKNIDDIFEIKPFRDKILSKSQKSFEYLKGSEQHLVNTKYIPELDLYLTIEANLDNFIQKTKKNLYLNVLITILMTTIIIFIVYITIKKHHNKLEYLSRYDALTDIPNRRYFEELFHQQMLLTKRNKQSVALIFVDIDDFKTINDDFGHNVGDTTLQHVSNILSAHIRETDIITRWGGEEFVIALLDSSLDESKEVAEKLRRALADNKDLETLIKRKVTGSFGLTMLKETDTQDSVIKRADEAMYESKNNNKNTVSIKLD